MESVNTAGNNLKRERDVFVCVCVYNFDTVHNVYNFPKGKNPKNL